MDHSVSYFPVSANVVPTYRFIEQHGEHQVGGKNASR